MLGLGVCTVMVMESLSPPIDLLKHYYALQSLDSVLPGLCSFWYELPLGYRA